MTFTLHQLRVFMTVAEKESVTRAAEELKFKEFTTGASNDLFPCGSLA